MEKTNAAVGGGEIKKGRSMGWLWVLVLLVAVVLVVWYTGLAPGSSGANGVYQAVFLSNNQVYFGKVSSQASQYIRLTDIYYLQIRQALQPREDNQPSQDIDLVKLGGELHGPQDEMRINRDHVLFIEDLKPDSQIVTAILKAKQQ